jgi:hypothetical protein
MTAAPAPQEWRDCIIRAVGGMTLFRPRRPLKPTFFGCRLLTVEFARLRCRRQALRIEASIIAMLTGRVAACGHPAMATRI